MYELPGAIQLSRLTVLGEAEPSVTVKIYIDNRLAGWAFAENGSFSVTVILSEGTNIITARATDNAGNVGPPSIARTVEYVRPVWAPPAPTLNLPPLLMNENQLTVSGSGQAGLIVEVYIDAEPVENTVVGIDNTLSITMGLHEGPNVITAVTWDLLGNPSGASVAWVVIADTTMVAPIVKVVENLRAGENAVIELGENLPIYELKIAARENVENLSIGVGGLKDRDGDGVPDPPPGIPAPAGVVYGYVRFYFISGLGEVMENAAFENVTIDFKVPRGWVQGNNIDENTIRLLKYANGWTPLETEFTKEEGGYLHFSARTTGLSLFAIVGGTPEEIPEVHEEIQSWWYLIAAPVLAAVVAVLAWRLKFARVERKRKRH